MSTRHAALDDYRRAEDALWQTVVGTAPSEGMVQLPTVGAKARLIEHGQGPTLLFIHGGPNAASTWVHLVAGLTGFRCVLVDRPGCGLSELPDPPVRRVRRHVIELVQDLLDVVDEAPAAIVASSFGGYALLAFAAAQPQRVPPSVLIGCPALVPGDRVPLPILLTILPVVGAIGRRAERPGPRATRRAFRLLGHPENLASGDGMPALLAWHTALIQKTPTRENDLRMFSRIRPRDRLTEADLAAVTRPVSFFWSNDDPFGDGDVARTLVARMPRADLQLVDDAGHLAWLDVPNKAADHVRRFLARM